MSKADDPKYMAETKAPLLYTVIFGLLAGSIVTVLLRLFCRIWVIKSVQTADYMITFALTLAIGQAVTNHIQIVTGMGKHVEFSHQNPRLFRDSLKAGYANNILYQSSLFFIKSSILSLYYRIASIGYQRRLIIAAWFFVALFCIACTMSVTLQCLPISAGFDIHNFPKGCYNITLFNFITSSINIFTDIAIFILPIPILAKINMNRNKKIALFATFGIGFIAVLASVLRVQSLVTWNGAADFTFDASVIPLWNAVEVNAGIISASLPPLKPLFRKAIDGTSRALSSSNNKRSRTRSRSRNVLSRVPDVRLSTLKATHNRRTMNATGGTDEEILVEQTSSGYATPSTTGGKSGEDYVGKLTENEENINRDTSWFKDGDGEGERGGIVVTYTVESEEVSDEDAAERMRRNVGRHQRGGSQGMEVVVEGGRDHKKTESRGRTFA